MHAHSPNIKSTGCLKGAFLLLSMTAALYCAAQSGEKLPDSVNTSEEVLPPKADPVDSTASTVVTPPADTGARDSNQQSTVTPAADTVVLRSVPDTAIASAKKDKDFEYANDPEYWKTDSVEGGPLTIPVSDTRPGYLFLKIILAVVVAVALLLVLYRSFYRAPPRAGKKYGDEQTELPEDDLDKQLEQALQAKNHRLSVRYLFLKALRLLDERKLIHYQARATNYEYVLQMGSHEAGPRFGFLAGAYEHVWYGDFSLSEPQFDRLLHYFEDFYKTINSKRK